MNKQQLIDLIRLNKQTINEQLDGAAEIILEQEVEEGNIDSYDSYDISDCGWNLVDDCTWQWEDILENTLDMTADEIFELVTEEEMNDILFVNETIN
jgi:hypothetical protein